MITRGTINADWNIDKIKSLPFIRYPVDVSNWPEASHYPEHLVTGSLCSDKTAEDNNLDWGWTDSLRIKNWKVCALSFYNLPPGHITPWHRDDYTKFKKHYQADGMTILRRLLFLEDSVPGQMFLLDNITLDNWKAGDWIQWTQDHRHMGTNHSDKNRFTCQLTGYII
jgi:hypothetical protein